jgi:hypothetical protein
LLPRRSAAEKPLGDIIMRTEFNSSRQDEYLGNGKDAEGQAKKTADPAAKEVWLRIAKSYYDLAALIPARRTIV